MVKIYSLYFWNEKIQPRRKSTNNLNMDRGKKKNCNSFFFSWPHHAAGGILVPVTRDKCTPSAVEACGPNHWTTRKITVILYTNLAKTCWTTIHIWIIKKINGIIYAYVWIVFWNIAIYCALCCYWKFPIYFNIYITEKYVYIGVAIIKLNILKKSWKHDS